MKWENNEFVLFDDSASIDWLAVHELLSNTYWASKRPKERTERTMNSSICFSLKTFGKQIGFGRVLTDEGCYAVILDVVVHPDYQKRGLGRWMITKMIEHPKVKGLRIVLWTSDKIDFYKTVGFKHETDFAILGILPEWIPKHKPQT